MRPIAADDVNTKTQQKREQEDLAAIAQHDPNEKQISRCRQQNANEKTEKDLRERTTRSRIANKARASIANQICRPRGMEGHEDRETKNGQ
jgi:hypothetical protein